MITGRLTAQREAVVRLSILDTAHQPHDLDAVMDTGFNGFLTLPRTMVQTLQLPLAGNRWVMAGWSCWTCILPQSYGTGNHARCWCWQQKAAR